MMITLHNLVAMPMVYRRCPIVGNFVPPARVKAQLRIVQF